MSNPSYQWITQYGASRSVRANTPFIRKGVTDSASAYLIRQGRARESINEESFREYGPGQFVGLESALTDSPRATTITALEDLQLVEIPADFIRSVLQDSHPLIQTWVRTSRSSRNHVMVQAPEAAKIAVEEILLANDFRNAVENQKAIHLDYQPVVNLKTGKTMGFEALMRWTAQDGTHIPPGKFIPVIEKTPLIHEASYLALRQACGAIVRFKEKAGQAFNMAVNFSTSDFLAPDFAKTVAAAVTECGYQTNHFYIEITERTLANAKETRQALEECHQMGIKCSLDDFGTSYSCLSYLCDFPIDTLKLDRSFIESMTTNEKSQRIVLNIIRLAKSIGAKSLAEGVETEEQADMLRKMHCDMAQGYFFGKPAPEQNILKSLSGGPG